MQNAVDQIRMTATTGSFGDFDGIQPITSWGDLVGETDYDPSGVVIPLWADMDLAVMDSEVPEPSARVQNPESSVRRVFSQKSDCRVWRKQAPSPSEFRVRSSQASEARNQSRKNNIGFPQEERTGEAKLSSKAPRTAIPSCQDWRRLPPQDFVRWIERPVRDASPHQHRGPATSSSENGVGPLQKTTPAKTVTQKQEMGGKNISIKPPITTPPPSQDWRTLPPKDFVRRMERPVRYASPHQHRGPATSSSENGVGPLQKTTPAKTVTQKQEMGGKNISIKPPMTTPPPSQDWRTLPPKDFVRRIERPVRDASPHQHRGPATSSSENGVGPLQKTTPAKTVTQKQEMGGKNISIKPPITTPPPSQDWRTLPPKDFVRRIERPVRDASPHQNTSLPLNNQKLRASLTETPLLQHQNLDSSSSTVIGVSPQEEKKNTTAKTVPQRQRIRSSLRTECSLRDLCKMLDGLHLSEKPTICVKPNSPRPILRPASFIYKTQPTFGFSQHHTSGKEKRKYPPAPPTPAYTSEHLPAPQINPRPSVLDDKNLYKIRKRRRLSYDS